jgi:hypothetical protein
MNDEERIIQVGVENVRTPITWHKDPTRHLLKVKAVNAKDSSDADAQQPQLDESSPDEKNQQHRAD